MRAYDPRRRGRRGLHQLPARPRSAQQQVAQVHLHLIVRLVVEQVEQQRQLAGVRAAEQSRTRRRSGRLDVPSINESVTFTRRASSTAGRPPGRLHRQRERAKLNFSSLILSV